MSILNIMSKLDKLYEDKLHEEPYYRLNSYARGYNLQNADPNDYVSSWDANLDMLRKIPEKNYTDRGLVKADFIKEAEKKVAAAEQERKNTAAAEANRILSKYQTVVYKPVLVSEAEAKQAEQEFKAELANGAPVRNAWGHNVNIGTFDFDSFHKAYDNYFKEAGLLGLFDNRGYLINKGTYGVLKNLEQTPAIKAAKQLYGTQYLKYANDESVPLFKKDMVEARKIFETVTVNSEKSKEVAEDVKKKLLENLKNSQEWKDLSAAMPPVRNDKDKLDIEIEYEIASVPASPGSIVRSTYNYGGIPDYYQVNDWDNPLKNGPYISSMTIYLKNTIIPPVGYNTSDYALNVKDKDAHYVDTYGVVIIGTGAHIYRGKDKQTLLFPEHSTIQQQTTYILTRGYNICLEMFKSLIDIARAATFLVNNNDRLFELPAIKALPNQSINWAVLYNPINKKFYKTVIDKFGSNKGLALVDMENDSSRANIITSKLLPVIVMTGYSNSANSWDEDTIEYEAYCNTSIPAFKNVVAKYVDINDISNSGPYYKHRVTPATGELAKYYTLKVEHNEFHPR